MNTNDAVALACAHQDQITHFLAWMGGIMPIASVLAWLTAKWNKMPAGAQALLQLAAGNLMHSLFGEPQPAPPAPVPAPAPVPVPAPPTAAAP